MGGGGVNRSTPIDLKTIDAEVAALAGRSPRTPIGMKELWDEVQNLKGSMKQWEIVTLTRNSSYTPVQYPFDNKYSSYNWIVLKGMISSGHYNRNQNTSYIGTDQNRNLGWEKSGNIIRVIGSFTQRETSETITVLFYK